MKGFSKLVGFAAVAAIALGFAGCMSYSVDSVQVSIEGDADSVDAGKTVQFNFQVNASGKDTSQAQKVKWSVSSTSDGNGPVTPGTSVSPGGTLSVSIDEIYPILYVRAAHDSFAYSGKYDFKQINVKGPKVGSVILSTAATSVVAGRTVKLSAFVAGQAPNQGLTYSVGSKSDGTGAVAAGSAIAGDGTLTVAAGETASSLYVKAQSNSDATKSAIQEIKIITVTSVTVSADGGTAKVKRGGSLKFSATVAGNNGPGQNVTWKVSANQAGTSAVTSGTAIAADGTLTVAAAEAAATLYVTATSTVDTTKSGSLAVVIPTVTAVAISPVNPQIKRGDGVTFTARVQGTGGPSQEVTWKLDGVGGAPSATTITSNGMLVVSTAETLSGLIVTAASVDDPAKFGTTMVTIPASPAAIVPVTPVTPPAATTVTPPAATGTTPAATGTTPAATNTPYIITGSGAAFTATKGGTTIGTANKDMRTVLNAIKAHAAGQTVEIQLGDGTTPLNVDSVGFSNQGGTWGAIILSGKVTGGAYYLVEFYDNVNAVITADIAGTCPANAVLFDSTGTLTIASGTISSSNSSNATVYNSKSGTVYITGGTISAVRNNIAVENYSTGKIIVSGTAVITSENTKANEGTVVISGAGTGVVRFEMTGGTVRNTSTTTGNAVFNGSLANISITGGTVTANSANAYAINSLGAASKVNVGPGATIQGRRTP